MRGSGAKRCVCPTVKQVAYAQAQTIDEECRLAFPGPISGSSYFNRVGAVVSGVSIRLFGNIRRSLGNNLQYPESWVQLALVYDRQPATTVPGYFDVFDVADMNGDIVTPAVYGVSTVYIPNVDRFQVLWVKLYGVPPVGVAGATHGTNYAPYVCDVDKLVIDESIALDGLESVYGGGTAGTLSNVRTGAYYLVSCAGTDHTGETGLSPWAYSIGCTYFFEDQ